MAQPQAHVEYVGFTTEAATREYVLRVTQPSGECREYTLAIALEAFRSRRVRFQDAPDICFRKLQRELAAIPGGVPTPFLEVSDAELEEYRRATNPPSTRRPKPATTT